MNPAEPMDEIRPMSPSSTFTLFPVVPYDPSAPPREWIDARAWIDRELQDLATALRNLIQRQSTWLLYGTTDAVTLTTGLSDLVNYSKYGFWSDADPSQIDQVAGTITIPGPGIYRVEGLVTGNLSSGNQNQAMALNLVVDGINAALAVVSVTSNQQLAYSLMGAVTRAFNGGEVVSLEMTATTTLGTFTIVTTNFQVSFLQDVP